jgi:hypothetical protein
VSMGCIDLESLKSFSPMIEVDKHYSFSYHMCSARGTSKCSLVRLDISLLEFLQSRSDHKVSTIQQASHRNPS